MEKHDGFSKQYPPTLLWGMGHSLGEAARLVVLEPAFDLLSASIYTGGGGPISKVRTMMGGANRKSAAPVMARLGGGGPVYAYDVGPFEPLKNIAAAVKAGENVGRNHHHGESWDLATDVPSPFAGIALCKRISDQAERGATPHQNAQATP